MRRLTLTGLVIAALAVTACGGGGQSPAVDWRAHADEVHVGQTVEEVEQILGEPDESYFGDDVEPGFEPQIIYGTSELTVFFDDAGTAVQIDEG